MKNIMSGVDKQIADYNGSFKALQNSLNMQNTIQCTVAVFRVFDSVKRMDQKVDEIRMFFVFHRHANLILFLIHILVSRGASGPGQDELRP